MAKRFREDVKHAIDLLWAHQIRRENASLHKQLQKVQHVQDNLIQENTAQGDLLRIAQDAQVSADKALAAVKAISSDLVALQVRCEQTESTTKSTFEQFEDLSQRLDVCEQNWHKNSGDVNGRIERNETALRHLHENCDKHMAKIQVKYDEISTKLESKLGPDSLEGLHLKVRVLERQMAELEPRQDSLSRVEESIELPDSQENGIHASFDHDSRHNSECEYEEAADGEEQMLTWRNVAQRESTADESFDLDGNIAIPSYAARAYQRPSSAIESLRPIPENDTPIESNAAEIGGLKQGRYHSWDRYLAEGQSIMDKIPREEEMLLVKSFVDGLYAVSERAQCRQWLDLSGWSWKSVAAFLHSGTPSTHGRINAPRLKGQQVATQALPAQDKPASIHEQLSVVNHEEASNLNAPHQKEPNTSWAPRRSKRIARSQNGTQTCEAMPDQNRQSGAKPDKHSRHEQNRSKSNGAPALERRTLRARKTLSASSTQEPPSQSRPSQESLHGLQGPAPVTQPAVLTPPRRSVRQILPANPRRDPGSVAITGQGPLHQSKSLKRAGLHDWGRTDSDVDDAAISDEVQLPQMPSPQRERRKKRKVKSVSKRRSMLPPPDIPILPTSE